MEFAKSALALPQDATGDALRQSVPDIIMLQAVTCALRDLGDLSADERALGLDRAELLIEKHAEALARRWGAGAAAADVAVPSGLCGAFGNVGTVLRKIGLGSAIPGSRASASVAAPIVDGDGGGDEGNRQ